MRNVRSMGFYFEIVYSRLRISGWLCEDSGRSRLKDVKLLQVSFACLQTKQQTLNPKPLKTSLCWPLHGEHIRLHGMHFVQRGLHLKD